MNTVFIQLGSNLGERINFLEKSKIAIDQNIGAIESQSKVYESTPWRVDGQPNYLNQILEIKTELSANDVLLAALRIEDDLGRTRIEKWGERLIDIDIIFYNKEIIETSELCIPHKHMHERNFVLEPLNEIAPNFVHPKYNKTVNELLSCSKDIERVKEYAI